MFHELIFTFSAWKTHDGSSISVFFSYVFWLVGLMLIMLLSLLLLFIKEASATGMKFYDQNVSRRISNEFSCWLKGSVWAIDAWKDYEEGNGAWLLWFIQWQMLDSRRKRTLEISIYLFTPQSPAAGRKIK